jgi:uncharacterized protein YodC (DUF2158 family)
MEDLEVGDVVILASGGPAMTVADILPWGEIFCLWFTPDRKCIGEVFNRCLLRRLHEQLEDAPTAPFYAPSPADVGTPRVASGTPPLGYEAVDEARPRTTSTSEDPGVTPLVEDSVTQELPRR